MLISYEEKLRIAQESLRQPSVNQIAETTGIHRSVVQKALNDPEIIELQETLKIHLRSRYLSTFPVDTPAPRETKSDEIESDEPESTQSELAISEETELRIREVEALESIATSLANLQSIFEAKINNVDATKRKLSTQDDNI